MSSTASTPPTTDQQTAHDAWPFAGAAAWQDLAKEQVARAQAFGEAFAKGQTELQSRLQATTDDALKLVAGSIAHLAALTAEWNRVVLDATRRATSVRE